ncbi:26S proteasome regulatory subunit 8 homolog B-like isoform X2 [Magnolia sinica]|uniref:26S proteasome regulatory subunit 8 homolog B-like isoform X2 n=1 Tax=Magnolia sinica TaxID=86752 RepID=UPI00265A4036|nr:26S proteasome regulatory subunit 8 homolog B-like isoform X2 [Magnolia sinica]
MGIVCWNKRLLITGNMPLQSSSWMRSTVLDLLVSNQGLAMVIVLMATNRMNILDQALLRPDWIDRKIEFPNPNEESRFNILKIHSRKMKLM